MMAQVIKPFYERHPKYYDSADREVPSVTTITGFPDKSSFLLPWLARELKKGRQYDEIRSTAAQIGTLTHAKIQAHLEGWEVDSVGYSQFVIDSANIGFQNYLEWERGKEIKPIFTEIQLVHEVIGYGGTVDAVLEIDGIPTIVDFKTSKSIDWTYFVQLAAYRELFASAKGMVIDDLAILRVSKDRNPTRFDYQPRKGNDLDEHFQYFRSLLDAMKRKTALEEKEGYRYG